MIGVTTEPQPDPSQPTAVPPDPERPLLVVMAAGLGSRFGGVKQLGMSHCVGRPMQRSADPIHPHADAEENPTGAEGQHPETHADVVGHRRIVAQAHDGRRSAR